MQYWLAEERPLVIAFVIMFLFTVFVSMIGIYKGSPTQDYGLWDFLLNLISMSVGLLSIRYIRGKEKRLTKPPYGVSHLTVWGYIWRYCVMLYGVMWVGMLLLIIVSVGGDIWQNFYLFKYFTWLLYPFVVWLLFCSERKKFAKNVWLYVNGLPRN